jgi:hypothetical protein
MSGSVQALPSLSETDQPASFSSPPLMFSS